MTVIQSFRDKTRKERYFEKAKTSIQLPAAIAAVNFEVEYNLAFLIRSAACFGFKDIYVIGSEPDRKLLNARSGSLYDFLNYKTFSNPIDFSLYCKDKDYKIVAVEMTENAKNLNNYNFDFNKKTVLVLGSDISGVPGNITTFNDTVYIPMLGPGFCLNTSQAGTAVMQEYCRQFMLR